MVIRETAQAMDRLGCRLMGQENFREVLSRHRAAMPLAGKQPKLPKTGFIAPSASVIGDVTLGEGSSVWYGAVLRGDVNSIRIGKEVNLQDGAVVHVAKEKPAGSPRPTMVGDKVTVGHGAVLHACTIEDRAFVGMGATVLDGAVVRSGGMLAAGAVLVPNSEVPSGQIWAGHPAKFMRHLSEEENAFIDASASNYATLASYHAEECGKSWEELVRDAEFRASARETSPDFADHQGVKHPSVAKPDEPTTTAR